MYTQCPDCEIAFKVTAKVLKRAAGKVRCGGCGNVFNALEFLTEQTPGQNETPATDPGMPELTPEISDAAESLPKSISAEQSAALLKTLDQLAGSDIRIEDTGVEWRVLDDPDASTPTFGNEPGASQETDDDSLRMTTEEPRFDDNTPLPDDFGLDDESPLVADPEADFQAGTDTDAIQSELDATATKAAQADFTLCEPDEWTDILGEFQESADAVEEAPVDESSGDTPLDVDSQFALQAEAMGIDISGIHELDAAVAEAANEELDLQAELSQLDMTDEQQTLTEEPVVETHTIENELAELDDLDDLDDELAADGEAHVVPPMSVEEQTVNMQIDQDLMALAVEDEDGFASTIIIPETSAEKIMAAETSGTNDDYGKSGKSSDATLFETIIMEGESVRSAADNESDLLDAGAPIEPATFEFVDEAEQATYTGNRRYGAIAGIVVLIILFAVQLMHQSREALATIPAFSNTIGQVYRALGQPVQPAWDVTGWRFEVTTSSTDGEPEDLIVYSRLGNDSDGPLPYPLISISLADRFEEPLGSRVLDPAEYLPSDLDPRELVAPGNTFNAVITIKSASADATSFNLKVCYRVSNGQLRCKDDGFR